MNKKNYDYCLILMASGFGRRFGSNKLLYEINGKAMYLYCLETLKEYCKQEKKAKIVLVTQYEEIESCLQDDQSIQLIHNEQALEGIAASVRLGVEAALKTDASWMVFFTADQPDLQEETIKRFVQEVSSSGFSMGSVCAGGQPGNPTIFHRKWAKELLQLQGDKGGRRIMNRHPKEVFWFEIPEEEIRDIDHPTLIQS